MSQHLFEYLRLGSDVLPSLADLPWCEDPLGDDDLQLTLYCCYELHYRGFSDVSDDVEWDPEVLRFRRELEGRFEDALRNCIQPSPRAALTPTDELAVIIDTGAGQPSPSRFMAEEGTIEQMREFAIHRSMYQLKEADAHTWGIPRYAGPSRSAMIEIQMDEYGNGRPGEAHAELFADTMRALGLDDSYGAYLERVGAPTLATMNLVSWLGLHRRLLPALLGHLAVFEMTSVVPMGRYAAACDRLGLGPEARRFYDVHVEADAHHGPLAATHLVGDYVSEHPESRQLVMWGAWAVMEVERRLAAHLMACWERGASSLRAEAEPTGRPHLAAA